jgi:homoserine O-acetyltransferase
MQSFRLLLFVALMLSCSAVGAADYPAPKEADWTIRDFKFHTGETIPELRIHYTTLGEPTGQPVLMLHGTTGSGRGMLTPAFAGELFGAGQPLDATKYFIILPDAIGHGKTSKPSDGLKTKFPKYNYDDMIEAQYRLVRDGLGIRHLRLVMGNSMGGMHAWMWGVKYPDYMDALVPMASQPSEMAARNWMLRRMLIESIRNDPDYQNGNYTRQPAALKTANIFFGIATAGGTLAYQSAAPTHAQADKFVSARLAAPAPPDANDYIYQWESSADYNPAPGLEKIEAALLAINAADDERNPPETGIMERDLQRVKKGQLYLIPASSETRGHGTTGSARFFTKRLDEFLQTVPQRSRKESKAN